MDAFDSAASEADGEDNLKARARVWWMFPKAGLGTPLAGGARRRKKIEAFVRSRLERWQLGERMSLWDDAKHRDGEGVRPAARAGQRRPKSTRGFIASALATLPLTECQPTLCSGS